MNSEDYCHSTASREGFDLTVATPFLDTPPQPQTEVPAESQSQIVLGLPELSLNGLSENWLLRHCGATHWRRLANLLQRRPEHIRDNVGNRLYASFISIELRGFLANFHEGDAVGITSELTRATALRYETDHLVINHSSGCRVCLSLCSTFVKRLSANDNVHLLYAEPAGMAQVSRHRCSIGSRRSTERRSADRISATILVDPSPVADFNAAGLFYFAQYQAVLDSAEWQLHRSRPLIRLATTERSISFHGNLNIGDQLYVDFMEVDVSTDAISHVAAIRRASDGVVIAEATTRKQNHNRS